MPPKQRQVRIESRSALSAMAALEGKSDEELMAEQKFKAAAQAILGARAAERMDAARSREHYRAAIAAARPQERMQLRRMAEASLALAERRAGDLKTAAEKLGQAPPSNRQLLALRVMGIVAPGKSAGWPRRIAGVLIFLAFVFAVLALGAGIVKLLAWPLGGLSWSLAIFWGFVLVALVLAGLFFFGRRRQKAARERVAAQRAEQMKAFTRRR
jgi:hypothetical protein